MLLSKPIAYASLLGLTTVGFAAGTLLLSGHFEAVGEDVPPPPPLAAAPESAPPMLEVPPDDEFILPPEGDFDAPLVNSGPAPTAPPPPLPEEEIELLSDEQLPPPEPIKLAKPGSAPKEAPLILEDTPFLEEPASETAIQKALEPATDLGDEAPPPLPLEEAPIADQPPDEAAPDGPSSLADAISRAAQKGKKKKRRRVSKSDLNIPKYTLKRPQWAIGLGSGPLGSGGSANALYSTSETLRFVQLQIEWQPKWTQSAGIFSIGGVVQTNLISGGSASFRPLLGNTGFGAVARYQFRYWREQAIVPVASFTGLWQYSLPAEGQTTEAFFLGQPSGGLWILLNSLDRTSASEFFINYGVLRSYLTVEAQYLFGTTSTGSLGELFLYAGLRFEF